MDSEDFKELRERSRANRKEHENTNGAKVVDWCEANGVSCKFINDWQVRALDPRFTVDIYTQTKKYHIIFPHGERGRIKGTINDFLTHLHNEHANTK